MSKPEGYWSGLIEWLVISIFFAVFLLGLWWQGRQIAGI